LDPGPHNRDPDGEGAGPGASADLIETGDPFMALTAEFPLFFEVRLADCHRQALIRWGP
jgi:hypothetical protein